MNSDCEIIGHSIVSNVQGGGRTAKGESRDGLTYDTDYIAQRGMKK